MGVPHVTRRGGRSRTLIYACLFRGMAPWHPGDGEVGNGGGGRMRGSGAMNWTTNRSLVRSGWAVDGRKARAGDPTPDLSPCLQVRVQVRTCRVGGVAGFGGLALPLVAVVYGKGREGGKGGWREFGPLVRRRRSIPYVRVRRTNQLYLHNHEPRG
jgi:hypothetical protein